MEFKLKQILKTLKINESLISTLLGGLVIVIIGLFAFNYFKGINKQGEITEEAPVEISEAIRESTGDEEPVLIEDNGKIVPQGLPVTYKVEKGESLWDIAEKFYTSGYNWVDIASENGISNPSIIYADTELRIPKVEVKQATLAKVQPKEMVAEVETATNIEGDKYTTVKGDHLWNIALRAYGDGYAWTKIYDANIDKIGANPGMLAVGVELSLPRGESLTAASE